MSQSDFVSPQSELGAFYFCPGVLSGYCCVCVWVVTVVCEKEVTEVVCAIRGSSEMSQIWVQWSHFWRLLVISPQSELGAFYFCPGVLSGYCCVCECGYCNWFWNTNIIKWLLWYHNVLIGYAIRGLHKCPKFGCSGHTFQGCWLLLILMEVSTQKNGQSII